MIVEFIICFADRTWETETHSYDVCVDNLEEDFCSTLEMRAEKDPRYSEVVFVGVYNTRDEEDDDEEFIIEGEDND